MSRSRETSAGAQVDGFLSMLEGEDGSTGCLQPEAGVGAVDSLAGCLFSQMSVDGDK